MAEREVETWALAEDSRSLSRGSAWDWPEDDPVALWVDVPGSSMGAWPFSLGWIHTAAWLSPERRKDLDPALEKPAGQLVLVEAGNTANDLADTVLDDWGQGSLTSSQAWRHAPRGPAHTLRQTMSQTR